ncbi:MAG: hypothetical protein ACOY4R_10125 [Pseudomonadota bacterium]
MIGPGALDRQHRSQRADREGDHGAQLDGGADADDGKTVRRVHDWGGMAAGA